MLHRDGQEVVDLRMGSVRQGEEGQQMPVIVNGGVISFLYSYPSLYFWTTGLTVSACLGGLLATGGSSTAGGGSRPLLLRGDMCRSWCYAIAELSFCDRQVNNCSANATMSCVNLGRSSLVTFCMTSSRFGLADYKALGSSSNWIRNIGICMQHNLL
jgi:hypothetical protein